MRLYPVVWVIAALAFAGCRQTRYADLIGTWANADGAMLILNSDGTFKAQSLPSDILLRQEIRSSLGGNGRWNLERHNFLWHGDAGRLELIFNDAPGYPPRMGVSIIVSSGGSSACLYQWVGEEGGERYELKKLTRAK